MEEPTYSNLCLNKYMHTNYEVLNCILYYSYVARSLIGNAYVRIFELMSSDTISDFFQTIYAPGCA